ncbi:hypothetical protein SEUCBS140593_005047 [Sporothrix eucalyptigena]|uniref:Uncharacterized protein n=1 Tax=Sporothrix eucalyptigena TaxID=1812306 RepID=A0ABP0BTI1_9PEZI
MRPPATTATAPAAADDVEPPPSRSSTSSHQLMFKKHKVLPHPRKDASYSSLRGPRPYLPPKNQGPVLATSAASSSVGALSDDASNTNSQPSSPRSKKQYPKTLGNGPDLPPTPPAHSRNSSSTYSVLPSSATYVQSPERSSEDVQLKPQLPTTPTKQLSPPTPDVTPPHTIQHELRPKGPALRPPLRDRNLSKGTTDSRTESFKTARENPSSSSSDNEDSFMSLRPAPISERTSESTVRNLAEESDEPPKKRQPEVVGLGLGLESSPEESITPKSKREFISFDGEWGSSSEEIPLASAAPIVAQMSTSSNSSTSDKGPRASTSSSRSTVSAVVEAVVLGTPLQRQRTLRHVKKQVALRDSGLDLSPSSSVATSLVEETSRLRRPNGGRLNSTAHDSVVSTASMNSVSSRSARREVWKAGGIPVIVVPSRLSSRTIDFPPTIPKRSSSLSAPTSRNVSRSGSLTAESIHAHSTILRSRLKDQEQSQSDLGRNDSDPVPASRQVPEAGPLVQQKAIEPEAVTSRSDERQRSNTVLFREVEADQAPASEQTNPPRPVDHVDAKEEVQHNDRDDGHGEESNYDHRNYLDPRSSLDRHVDRHSARHLSPHNTPFSMISVETATTHHSLAEVSEAFAVSIYPHQNTSVLVVDHSTRPSDCSDDSQRDRLTDPTGISTPKEESSPASIFTSALAPSSVSAPPPDQPKITRTEPDAKEDMPVTPSHQQLFSLDDVDSPLRNPRSPPEPPAINFIPATPSGLTPSTEREIQRGNYFEETRDGRPRRRRSVSMVLRRALSRGRSTTTDYGPSASRSGGLLTRTLSLTRDVQRRFPIRRSDSVDKGKGISFDMEPPEEDKLHPFWRPASSHRTDDEDYDYDNEDEETYRYPPIDNRPRGPRRSLSMRMKRTFAILPIDRADDFYPATSDEGPERRTVRRTPSGNLRVVKHRGSTESLGEYTTPVNIRPYTAPERHGNRKFRFWRSPSLKGKVFQPRDYRYYNNDNAMYQYDTTATGGEKKAIKILPNLGLGDKIGEYGPHTIPRRFSERRREKRSNELRQMISGPQEVRDGVGEVIRRTNYRDAFTQAQVG